MAAGTAAGAQVFIGRAAELDELRALLDAATSGRGSLALVAGEAGIGKTSLLERLAVEAAGGGVNVVWASCWHGPDRPSYWPWVQLLRALDVTQGPTLLETPGGESRPRLFDDVVGILRGAAVERPLLALIDDLHWADAASVQLLIHAARSLRAAPVMFAGGYRDSEVVDDHPLSPLLADHVASANLPLGGFAEEEVAALVRAVVGDHPRESATIHRRTGGNPLFTRELLRLLTAEGRLGTAHLDVAVPAGVRAVLQRRLDQLPPAASRALGAAAVVGEEFDLPLLSAVTGMAVDDLAELVEQAVAARLVADGGSGRARFAHPLVRDVRYAALGSTERSATHLAVARALADRHAADVDPHLRTVAHHLLRAGSAVAGEASETAVAAAGRALAVLDHEGAVELLRAAAEAAAVAGAGPARRGEILLLLGDALVRAGDMPAARDVHAEAADLARRAGDPTLLARAALGYGAGLAGFEIRLWDRSQIDVLEEALATLPGDASALRASLMARLSVALSLADRPEQREPLSREAVGIARRAGDPETLAYTLSSYADAIAGPDHVAERLDVATEIVELARGSGNTPLELLGRRFRVVALLELGRLPDVDAEIAAYASLAARLRQPLYSWYVPLWLGMRALLDGRLADCERLVAEAAEAGRQAHSQNAELLTNTLRLHLWEVRGDIAERLAESRLVADIPQEALLTPGLRAVLALLAVHTGQRAQAQAELDRFTATGFAELHHDAEYLSNLTALAHVADALRDARAAARLAALLEPYAALLVVDGIAAACDGSVAHLLGVLAAVQGHSDEAVRRLEEAVDVHARLGALPLAILSRRELARALRIRARPGDAERAAELVGAARAAGREMGIPAGDEPAPIAGEPAEGGQFLREGDVWLVVYAGKAARVRDAKGMRDLARLLATPGRAIHVSELATAPPPRRGPAPPAEEGLRPGWGPVADPVIDRQAREAYRRRIDELRAEIGDAETCNDPVRAGRAREELDLLTAELARAFGLGGRARSVGDPVERARKAVAARIREAIGRIERAHPDLARHLTHSVRTGTLCVYEPEQPVRWRV